MAYMQTSLAYELYRPAIDRYAPIVAILFLVGMFWIGSMDSQDEASPPADFSTTVSEPSETITMKAGEIEVPIYYFPDSATGTDKYVSARDADCGQASGTPPHDYPRDWMKP